MKYYYVTAWINLENIMLSERNQIPKNTYSMIPFDEMSRTGRSIERESSLAVTGGKGEGDNRVGLLMGMGFPSGVV